MDPGIADLLGDNGQVVPLFPKHFRYFVHRTRFDRIAGELLFDRFQLFEDMVRARRTVIVERMVKIQNLFDARVLKRAAVIARIDHDHLGAVAFPQKARRDFCERRRAVDAEVQKLDAVLRKQRHERFRVPGHIGHFGGDGLLSTQLIRFFHDGQTVFKRIRIQKLGVRGKRQSMRHDVPALKRGGQRLFLLFRPVLQRVL